MSRARRYAPIRWLHPRTNLVHRARYAPGWGLCGVSPDNLDTDWSWWLGILPEGMEPGFDRCPKCDTLAITAGLIASDAAALADMPSRPWRKRIVRWAETQDLSPLRPASEWLPDGTKLWDDLAVREFARAVRAERAASWLTIKDVAAQAGIAEATVRSYLARGLMPEPIRDRHGHPTWTQTSIDRWLANRPGKGNRTPRKPINPGDTP